MVEGKSSCGRGGLLFAGNSLPSFQNENRAGLAWRLAANFFVEFFGENNRGIWANKLTWLVLGGDPAVCSHRVEQLTAL